MTLLSICKTRVNLPELVLQRSKIAGNYIRRYAEIAKCIDVEVFDSDYSGLWELHTKLSSPYDLILLKKHKHKAILIPNGRLCLKSKDKLRDCHALDVHTKLEWLQHYSHSDSLSPSDITAHWSNSFQFRESNIEKNERGLRLPQIGALHAASAYFTLENNKNNPATIVLPTGTGKTETMLALLIYRKLPKLLVIVPSSALREQIAEKFYGLGCLVDLGIVPPDIALPFVAVIKHGIQQEDDACEVLRSSNVIIATPDAFNASSEKCIDILCEGISDLFIDEAHHVAAKTWKFIKDKFIGKRIVQFTATPFRRDGKSLDGKVIYNYTMREAQQAGYFKHIRRLNVIEYDPDNADLIIAQKAIDTLQQDLAKGYNHILMVRAMNKKRADALSILYKKLAARFSPQVIYSNLSPIFVRECLQKIRSGEARIVICVDMLGEGFDLPNLKIAAMHDLHRSLAITLQFIGRFTREIADKQEIGDAAIIFNEADPEVEHVLQNLYSQSADWDNILRGISEERITREINLQEIIEQLKTEGNLHDQLALWNLRPALSAIFFRTHCDSWNPQHFAQVLPSDCADKWYSINDKENILVVLAVQKAKVKWGRYQGLYETLLKLLIVKWDKTHSGLFMYSNDHHWFRHKQLAKDICDNSCELASGPKVYNIFNGVYSPIVRNIGTAQFGAISFAQYFGPNVTEGLTNISRQSAYLSNLAGIGYDEGEKVVLGCSLKQGKIWSARSGTILDWIEWGQKTWEKISNTAIDPDNITRKFLCPEQMSAPYSQYAFAISWGEHIQASPEDNVIIIFGDKDVPLYLVDLEIEQQQLGSDYQITIKCEEYKSIYCFSISSAIQPRGFLYQHISGPKLFVKRGNRTPEPIDEYFDEDPLIICYVDNSHSYNRFLIKLPSDFAEFSKDQITCLDWTGIDIKKESMRKIQEEDSVQWKAFQHIRDDYDIIINDDGNGEAADLIAFKLDGNELHLGLVHCKYSQQQAPGARIEDIYTVCGQANKSIYWKHVGLNAIVQHIINREQKWELAGFTRFLKGDVQDLRKLKRFARMAKIKLTVFIVQPGLKKDKATPPILKQLGATAEYLKKTSQAELLVLAS